MENQNEIWKDIPGFENKYKVSNLGNVMSLNYMNTKKEKILQKGNMHGYYSVCLYSDKKQAIRVHQLVAMAFLGHKRNGVTMVINHKNFNTFDNRLDNLEVVTARENSNKKHLKSTSKYVGVCWYKQTNKWKAQISIKRKKKSLGYFKTEIEAHNAYQLELSKINQFLENIK